MNFEYLLKLETLRKDIKSYKVGKSYLLRSITKEIRKIKNDARN